MAKNYTDSEIEEAVTKLVLSSVRRPYGSLGNRGVSTTFNDLQDAAAGVFILTPNAPFYVVYLGSEKVSDLLPSLTALVDSLIDAVESTGRYVTPVENLNSLVNARVALGALEGAASSRTRNFEDIASVPAYQRYIQNTDRFLSESSSNVRDGGDIVQTPAEARSGLASVLSKMLDEHTEVLRRCSLLSVAIEDFDSMSLGNLVASNIISNVRSVLDGRIEELEALTPIDRNAIVRDVTLDILAGRAAVTGFSSLVTSSTFVSIEGTGEAYTDDTRTGTAAIVQGDLTGPFPILPDTQEIELTVDNGPTLSILLQGSFVAFIDGALPEPFDIYGVGNPPPAGFAASDHVLIEVPGHPDLDFLLTKGSGVSVETIVGEINAAITTQPIVAEPAFVPEKFAGAVELDATGSSSDMDFVFDPPTAGDWTALPIEEGDKVVVDDDTSVNDGAVYTVDAGGITATTLTCTQVSGPAPSDELVTAILVGAPNRFIRIRISDGNEAASLANRQVIRFPTTTDPAYLSLGFFAEQEMRSRNTTAHEVVESVNTSFGAQVSGVARAVAEAAFVPSSTLLGRSEPTNPQIITLFRWRGYADYTSGTNSVFTIDRTDRGDLDDVQIGDSVVIRTSSTEADIGAVGIVTAVASDSFTATFGTAVTASSGDLVEIGPTAPVTRDTILQVEGTSPNAGDHEALDPGSVPFDVEVLAPLTFYQAPGGLPYYFSVDVGQYRVDFLSLSEQSDSHMSVDGPAAPVFLSVPPVDNYGSTPYILLPSAPSNLEVGDTVEVYTTQYNIPSSVFSITALELDQLLVKVTPEVPNNIGVLEFSQSSVVPFVKIRKNQKNNYDVFKEALTTWLALPENQESFFTELNRLLNPVIVNSNPSASDIGTAVGHLRNLLGVLTIDGANAVGKDPDASLEAVLATYQVGTVPQVDTLFESFRQQGADRAVDYLSEGQFSVFFGLPQTGVSYLGNAMHLLRDVQAADFPVRKVRRPGVRDQEIDVVSYEEPDAEFDFSDVENVREVDLPGQFTTPGDGSVY